MRLMLIVFEQVRVPIVAVITGEPGEIAVTTPVTFTVAALADKVQVTVEVRFAVLPSVYVPVAVNWLLEPVATHSP